MHPEKFDSKGESMKFLGSSSKGRAFQKFLVILPFMALVFTFSYFPLYGWLYTFYDYQPPIPFSKSPWVGLHWFSYLFGNATKIKQLLQVLQNTFAISGLGILFSWLPMVFAIFLNEIKSVKYRKTIQTVTTLPNFISWVLVFSLAFSLFANHGMVNDLLKSVGASQSSIRFLESPNGIYFSMWMWYTWKEFRHPVDDAQERDADDALQHAYPCGERIAAAARRQVVYVQVQNLYRLFVERVLEHIVLLHAVVQEAGDLQQKQNEICGQQAGNGDVPDHLHPSRAIHAGRFKQRFVDARHCRDIHDGRPPKPLPGIPHPHGKIDAVWTLEKTDRRL
jgi:hypothetical protein